MRGHSLVRSLARPKEGKTAFTQQRGEDLRRRLVPKAFHDPSAQILIIGQVGWVETYGGLFV